MSEHKPQTWKAGAEIRAGQMLYIDPATGDFVPAPMMQKQFVAYAIEDIGKDAVMMVDMHAKTARKAQP